MNHWDHVRIGQTIRATSADGATTLTGDCVGVGYDTAVGRYGAIALVTSVGIVPTDFARTDGWDLVITEDVIVADDQVRLAGVDPGVAISGTASVLATAAAGLFGGDTRPISVCWDQWGVAARYHPDQLVRIGGPFDEVFG